MSFGDICPQHTIFQPGSERDIDSGRNFKFAELYKALLAEPYDKVDVEHKFISWTTEQKEYLVPCLIVAGLTLLLWLPLWISRCCAHRCCAPSEHGPSVRQKKIWIGVFCGAYWASFFCAIIGVLACIDLWFSVRSATCVSLDSFLWVDEQATEGFTAATAAGKATASAARSVNFVVSNTTCAKDSLSQLCPLLDGALLSAEEIRSITGDNASDEFIALYDDVRSAAVFCKAAVAALEVGFFAFEQVLVELLRIALDLSEPIKHSLQFFEYASRTARDAAADVRDAYDTYDPIVETVCIVAAAVLFFSPILVNSIAAALIGYVMWKPEAVKSRRKVEWGVQIVGCSWVLATIICFFYFLAAALLLIGGEGARQAGAVFMWSASNFEEIYNNTIVCDGPMASHVDVPIDVDDLGQMCNLTATTVSECWAGGNFIEALVVSLGSETTVQEAIDAFTKGRTLLSSLTFDPVAIALNGITDSLDAAVSATAALEAVDFFNISDPSAEDLAAVESLKADMDTNLTMAYDLHSDEDGCYGSFIAVLSGTVDAAIELIDAGLQTLSAVYSVGECTEFPDKWMAVVFSVYDVAQGPLVCAVVGLIVTGVLVFVYAPGSIAMQIIYGGVGHEPGCPRMCRCCCPPGKRMRTMSEPPSIHNSKAGSVSDQAIAAHAEAGEVDVDRMVNSKSSMSKVLPATVVGEV